MKSKAKKILALFMTFALVMTMSAAAAFAAPAGSVVQEAAADQCDCAAADEIHEAHPQVMLNGEYMAFDAADSLPRNINGRIMVPYRAIFESLGAQVDYDEATGIISGSYDGMSLTMQNGGYNINITNADGTAEVLTMDTAPYIEDGRTFVPARFVSEVLDYSVGWDEVHKAVIIIDVDSIFENANEDFSIYMKVNDMSVDMEKAYEVNGVIEAEILVQAEGTAEIIEGAEEPAETTMSGIWLSGDINGMVQGLNEELAMDLQIDADGEVTEVNGEVKFDGETGDMYVKADDVTEEGQWLKLNIYDMYDEMLAAGGMDMRLLMEASAEGSLDMAEMLSSTFKMSAETFDISAYATIESTYALMKAMFGNEAFVKTETGYEAEFSGESIARAVAEASGADIEDVMNDMGLNDALLKGSMVIDTDENDKAVFYSMGFAFEMEEVAMSMVAESSATETAMAMAISVADAMEIAMSMNMLMEESTGTVDTTIPAGETAVDFNELLTGLIAGKSV